LEKRKIANSALPSLLSIFPASLKIFFLEPKVLSLDYEDDPKMFEMPEDAVQDEGSDGLGSKSYSKVFFLKFKKILFFKKRLGEVE